jgi:hypothetical protein
MKNWLKTSVAALAVFAAIPAALAQTVPASNPTYIPQALEPAAMIATGVASNYAYQVNGAGAVLMTIAGSPSGLAAVVQGAVSRSGTIAWVNIPADQVGGPRVAAIVSAGTYHINSAGYAQVRLAVSALTSGATTVAFSGGLGQSFETILFQPRASFSAASLIATGATTHFLVVAGSATKAVRITHVECSGFATTAINEQITAEIDSAADTVDAGTALTVTPHDSTNVAATATVVKHTTSPTSGALVGLVRAGAMILGNAATVPPTGLSWDFGNRPGEQEIVLRGVAQQFALNTSAAFGTGGSVGCAVTLTEE